MSSFFSINRRSGGIICSGTVCTGLALCLLGASAAQAGPISPTSYTYTNGTPAGQNSYTDQTHFKLTDGVIGTVDPTDGSWVGWQFDDSGAAQITFHFGGIVTVTSVGLDFLRSDGANTQLPDSVTIGANNFATTDFATDATKGFVTYTGSWTGSTLAVTLNHPTSHWVFLNEVQFNGGNAAIPEPATFGLAFAGLAIAGIARKPKSMKRKSIR